MDIYPNKSRLAVNLFFFINGFTYANWIARLPRIQEKFQLDNGGLGLLLLCVSVGALLAMPFTGWLIVRNGSRKITTVAGLLFCSIAWLIAWAPNVGLLGLVFFAMGLSAGSMDVAMNAQAVLVEQALRKPIMSFFHALFSAGMMIGAGMGALFTKVGPDLLIHLTTVLSIGLLVLVWAQQYLVNDRVVQAEETEGSAFRLPTRALWGIGVVAFCAMLGEGAMSDWTTNYMLKVVHADAAFAPMGLAAFAVAMMLGRFLGDRARALYGDRSLLIACSLLATAGLSLALLVIYPIVVLIGLFLVGFGLSVIVPIAYSKAGSTAGLSPGVGIGMVTTIGYSGFLFGPPIIGFLADWQTLRIALLFVVALFVLMTLLTFRLER